MFEIPAEKLPDSLKDEQRINVLFAPLRNRSVNSKDWESKIASWRDIIKLYCESNNIYSFTLSSLNKIFIRNGRPPSCLNEVITEMARNGDIQIIDIFLKKDPDSWSGWATDLLIKRPLSWSLNKIKSSIFTPVDNSNMYVHLEVIKSKCDHLISSVPSKFKNKLMSLQDLLTILEKDSNQAENVKLLLHYLLLQHKIDITKLHSNTSKEELDTFLVKCGDGQKISPISEIDIGIYTLEKNEKLISKHIESLEDEIQNCIKEAKTHLSKNHRQMAKASLKKKHELEKRTEKKVNALHNIQTLLEQIRETHTDAHVWEAYKNALSAYNTTFKDTGLSEDAVEDTIIKLGDMLEMHDDIQTALARPAVDINDSDLEEELAELLKDGATSQPPGDPGIGDLEKQMEKMSLNFPDVPSESPDVSVQEISLNN